MSQTTDEAGVEQTPGDVPPHRYTPALAQRIELAWQDRWEAEGTFHTPNPSGRLSGGSRRFRSRARFLGHGVSW